MTIHLIVSTVSSHWRAAFTLGLIFLMSCQGSATLSDGYVSKEQAIDAALENAMMAQPEISGPQEKPSNINAEQMRLAEAVKKINEQNEPAAEYDSNMMVWFVSMDGIWLDEFPRPADFPTPAPYRHYVVVVDARTAQTIESAGFP